MKKYFLLMLLSCCLSFSVNGQAIVDVLILYSNQATSSGNLTHATSSVNHANESFINSGLDNVVQLNLVGAAHLNYSETGNTMYDHRAHLVTNSTVANLRNLYGADLVFLMVNSSGGGPVGLAEFSPGVTNSNKAFAVVVKSSAITETTFTHELGHLVGAVHQDGQLTTSRGFITTPCSTGDITYHYKTIMVQSNQAGQRIHRWSNPADIIVKVGEAEEPGQCGPGGCSEPTVCNIPLGTSNDNSYAGWVARAGNMANFKTSYSGPQNLTVTQGGPYGEPYLDWDDHPLSTSQSYYNVYRKTNSPGEVYKKINFNGPVNNSNYSDWEVSNKHGTPTTFSYRVKLIRGTSDSSGFSNPAYYDGMIMNLKGLPNNDKPEQFSLSSNYPNPFNPSTQIKFGLPEDSDVSLRVYNLMGQEVAVLVDDAMNAGFHEITFNADNLPSGTYFAKIIASSGSTNTFTKEIKMQLIK